MDKCPTVEFGVQDTHLKKKRKEEKKYIEHLSPLGKILKQQDTYREPATDKVVACQSLFFASRLERSCMFSRIWSL